MGSAPRRNRRFTGLILFGLLQAWPNTSRLLGTYLANPLIPLYGRRSARSSR